MSSRHCEEQSAEAISNKQRLLRFARNDNGGIFLQFLTLLKTEFLQAWNRQKHADLASRRFRLMLLVLGCVIFILIFAGSYRAFDHILNRLTQAPELGRPLVLRLIEMTHLLFFVMLIISSLSVALSVFYLDPDIAFLMTTPISHGVLLLERIVITVVRSAWFVLFAGAPMLLAYVCLNETALMVIPVFVGTMMVLTLFVIPPVMIGVIASLLIVRYIPARRAKAALLVLSVISLSLTIVGMRWMMPERFLRPKIDPNIGLTLSALAEPASPWLPSGWAAEAIVLNDTASRAKLLAAAVLAIGGALAMAMKVHLTGLDRIASERQPRVEPGRFDLIGLLVRPLSPDLKLIAQKDLALFWRNPTQWSQLIVLLALVVIYVFNFRQFKGEIDSVFMKDIISFVNIGMAGFVLVAIANRFVFSALSLEGRAIWLLRSSPFPLSKLLFAKSFVSLLPLLFLSEVITVLANRSLEVSLHFIVGSGLIVALMTVSLISLAVGLGAINPRFDLKDPAQIGMSPTGIIYMGLGLLYVGISVTMMATYMISAWKSQFFLEDTSWTMLLIPLVVLTTLNACAIIVPWKLGTRKIDALELRT